ncbi:permease-like cell division protein FtsX [Sphaerisporangium sp. TRM90804]|uniref:permease-like cell division protein FtsX n=1 Tax=Sphaerisporangium sp. TRM90804 TaxID=3031113 RepID=UPI002446CA38|nr:permease-like cell division protein FtsX [Sphaerisporangium sp. TRM90804]MDH2427818.1 permease-like cell division protein FtsX [Sphaerisporangium sp. TRM90804]
MDARADVTEAEELSFGDDPDSESRLRRWSSAHGKTALAGMTVLAVLLVAVAGARFLSGRSLEPLPPPDVAFPEQLGFRVELCEERWPTCWPEGRESAKDIQRVEAALRAIPEVSEVRFVSQEEVSEELRRYAGGTPRGAQGRRLVRMAFAEGFRGTMRHASDFARVAEQARDIPGVQGVERRTTGFWEGKADVAVRLCGRDDQGCPLAHRPISPDRKRAVLETIQKAEGVDTVYLSDPAFEMRLERHYDPGPADSARARPEREVLYVKTDGPAEAALVLQAVEGMPGVEAAWRLPPPG